MGCEVYANSDEIACKAGDGKVIAAFPDVCLSPPSPPAGPLPVPYPNTSFSKDMKNGSKTVKIKDKEVMLKDKSFYKTSPLGDEAATKSLGAGGITHVITGKTYFVAWSPDVKFEGQNVDRNMDFTTSNHASPMANNNVPNPNVGWYSTSKAQAKSNKCRCCGQGEHVKTADSSPPGTATAMSEKTYYTTDAAGTALPKNHPKVRAFNKLAKDRKNRKSLTPSCTCNGQTAPKSPCNVFYKGISNTEKNAIRNTASPQNPNWYPYKVNKLAPLPYPPAVDLAANLISTQCLAQDNITQTQGELNNASNEEKRANHIVPKQAGGCPMGDNNVEMETRLCGRCRSFEFRIGKIQGM